MILKKLKISTWSGDATNCYIVFDEETKETMVIDPAGDVDKIIEIIDILKGNVKYIYLTHCHGDHIGGVTELKEKKGGKIIIHRNDAEGLNDVNINLTHIIDMPEIHLEADSRIDDGDKLHLGNLDHMRYFDDELIIEPTDKYKGILEMVKIQGGNEKNIVVFGDGHNDLSMVKQAPIGIAMGNANDELKDIATFVTKRNDDDGIAYACQYFGWI